MKTRILAAALLAAALAAPAFAQAPPPPGPPPPPGGHGPQHGQPPPPNAYTDCKGKRAGDTVQHATPQGTVRATCQDSPEGLVARPERQPPRQ